MTRWALLVVALLCLAVTPRSCRGPSLNVGSKTFTESVILGEMAAQLARSTGVNVTHRSQLGGTRLLFDALVQGEIDVYPEYTGTLKKEVLADQSIASDDDLKSELAKRGIEISEPLGFNNTYSLGVKRETAQRLDLKTVSDLASHLDLKLGFSNEFMDRADGWPGLRVHYNLQHEDVRGLDHDLAYRMLDLGSLDVIDIYATDAKIAEYDITLLEDDRQFFTRYDAVLLTRTDLESRWPSVASKLSLMQNALDEGEMTRLNGAVELEDESEAIVAASFLDESFGIRVEVEDVDQTERIKRRTLEHLDLVRRSLIPAILVAIPLGVLAAKQPAIGQVLLFAVGIVQTIPALALLALLLGPVHSLGLPSLGTDSLTAIVALFLYSLLPIVRNTCTGLTGIPPHYRESAEAIGLPPAVRLLQIELPLASQTILAGVKTAAVVNVGFATLGALIGAGGYGQPILTGIRLNSTALILEGAVPAAALALCMQGFFELSEGLFVPRGLRLKRS